MYFKLSFRNVKRSFRDYAIYFLTITFGVCLFYSFNSLSSQQVILNLSNAQEEIVKSLMDIIGVTSIFISVVLAFLILFANSFLIRRRKKELGMYMTLGMSEYNISRILVTETLLIGLASLGAGLGLGTLFSQGLSILTASLFKVDMNAYEFVFSTEAMLKTIFYFGIIFIVVMIFNIIVINRYKLIDLLTANKKNQSIKLRKNWVAVGVFVLSIIIIGTSYGIMLEYGLFKNNTIIWFSVGLGSIGTFLFFFSLSGFMLNMFRKNERIYYKHINMFVLRQINSKVNSTFVSMTVICLMLFFTIGTLSTGFSLKGSLEKDLEETTPYDASFYVYNDEELQNDPNESFNRLDVEKYGDTVTFNEYQTGESVKAYLRKYDDKKSKKLLEGDYNISLAAIKQSEYEDLLRLQGEEPVSLNKDEVLIISNREEFKGTIERFIKNENTIGIDNEKYSLEGFQYNSIMTESMATNTMMAVMPDAALSDKKITISVMNLQYDGAEEKADEEIYNSLKTVNQKNQDSAYILGSTKTLVYEEATGTSTIIVYIGVYLGIVFLISSAAILALQQLSEASENMERYSMLKKIGVTQKSINQSIFRQIFIYFMMPLSLAVVHSIFGIKVVNDALLTAGQADVLVPSLITAGVIIFVYGGYFLATYSGYKSIVK